MPSTYTTRNRLEKIATGEKLNIWGESQNAGTLDPLDQTLDGVGTVDLGNATTFDLTTATYVKNGEADTARCRVLEFSNANAAGTLVTILGVQKVYFIRNLSANPITIAPTGGVVATVRGGQKTWVYSNGTNCYALNDPTLDQILPPAGTVNLGAQKMQSSAAPTTGNDFVNKTYADAIITVASGYATAAGNSATAADASAVAAAASLAEFEAQYTSDPSAPGSPSAGYLWFNETNDQLNIRNAANTAWGVFAIPQPASETTQGIVEIATQAETNAGTDDERAVTPKKLLAFTKARPGNVVKADKTDTFSTSSTSFTDLTGLSVSITPSSASSRIEVTAVITGATSLTSNKMFFKLVRDSTDVLLGDAASSRVRAHTAFVGQNAVVSTVFAIDSPATTSATTYKVQCAVSAGTGYVNRDNSDSDAATTGRYASTITVMEII